MSQQTTKELLPVVELHFDYISEAKRRKRYVLLDDNPQQAAQVCPLKSELFSVFRTEPFAPLTVVPDMPDLQGARHQARVRTWRMTPTGHFSRVQSCSWVGICFVFILEAGLFMIFFSTLHNISTNSGCFFSFVGLCMTQKTTKRNVDSKQSQH